MSHIYEALRKADREYKAAPVSEGSKGPMPEVLSDIGKPPTVGTALSLELIAQYTWHTSAATLPTLADRGIGVEQFRGLRSRVYQARHEAGMKTILVSSGMPSEGKSFVTANLAVSLARNAGNRVLLIDGDLRRPTLHSLLGAPDSPGLSEYLMGSADVLALMQRGHRANSVMSPSSDSLSNLMFIPAGKCGDMSSELVGDHRLEELIATVAPHFDWILIDSPPVLAVTDAVELSRVADAVLLVARGEHTPYDAAQRTQAAFSNSRIIGFVLNDVKETSHRDFYYSYYPVAQRPNQQTR
jgi:protein-tyrosine kinase